MSQAPGDKRPPAAKPVSNRTTPVVQAAQPTPRGDSNAPIPLQTGANAEHGSQAKADSAAPTAASTPESTVGGRNTSSSGVHLPSSQADYLNNPQPPYPALSLRLRESGKVMVRVLIGRNGLALRGEIVQSSGFERLDQSALRAVLAWRYVPGKVDGQAQDMWFDVPISFRLPN
ncbi:energy transducer TonB [Rhodoferax sp. U11-2br]|uniref:energy transducer TonB n=1 Tax=Rhodoferax sp. U11-2br TaxID=2838878 RepID=UPI001BE5DE5C|nr:energy transducer TonB [Rhodoferax sp. U11-2br]MBT3066219.1 energy transducer TonB [Rhodoferax sp. U11-2br]